MPADATAGELCLVGAGADGGALYLPLSSAVNLKLALKKKVSFKKSVTETKKIKTI